MAGRRPISRRIFLKRATAAVAAPTIVAGSSLGLGGAVAPSERITMAFVRTGNQGCNDLGGFLHDKRV